MSSRYYVLRLEEHQVVDKEVPSSIDKIVFCSVRRIVTVRKINDNVLNSTGPIYQWFGFKSAFLIF